MAFDGKNQGDAKFERSLLESARSDAPPHDAHDAWTRFAGTLGMTIPSQASGDGFSDTQRPSASAAAGTLAKAAGTRAVYGAAVKWLLLGAIGGSAVTAVVMVERPGRRVNPHVLILDRQAAPSPDAPRETPARQSFPVPSPEAALPSGQRTTPTVTAWKRSGQGRARPIEHQAEAPQNQNDQTVRSLVEDSSTLAAEVSLIDEARTAVTLGEHDEALRLIERYHRSFPNGALAPDADVVALEAAAANRDASEVARRAALFLSRYPSDPHAARVRWLARQRY